MFLNLNIQTKNIKFFSVEKKRFLNFQIISMKNLSLKSFVKKNGLKNNTMNKTDLK